MYSLTFGSFLWSAPVQEETAHHCFLYFIKLFYIFRALDCDQMRPFFESVRVKIWRGRTCASAWSACSKARVLPAAAHCSRRKISLIRRERFSRAWFHTARVKAEQRQRRSGVYAEREQRAHCAFTPHVSTSAKVRAAEDLVFKLK